MSGRENIYMSMESPEDEEDLEDVYSTLNDNAEETDGKEAVAAAKLGPLPSLPNPGLVAVQDSLASNNATLFCHCEDNVCKLANGVKLNPFYVRHMRSGNVNAATDKNGAKGARLAGNLSRMNSAHAVLARTTSSHAVNADVEMGDAAALSLDTNVCRCDSHLEALQDAMRHQDAELGGKIPCNTKDSCYMRSQPQFYDHNGDGNSYDMAAANNNPYYIYYGGDPRLMQPAANQEEVEKRQLKIVRMAVRERRLKLTAYVCVVFIAIVLLLAIALGAAIFFRTNPHYFTDAKES